MQGFTIRRFAAETGIDASRLSKIERDRIPPGDDAGRIATALGIEAGSDDRREFDEFAAAADRAGPAPARTDAEVALIMPIACETSSGEPLSDDQARGLWELMRERRSV